MTSCRRFFFFFTKLAEARRAVTSVGTGKTDEFCTTVDVCVNSTDRGLINANCKHFGCDKTAREAFSCRALTSCSRSKSSSNPSILPISSVAAVNNCMKKATISCVRGIACISIKLGVARTDDKGTNTTSPDVCSCTWSCPLGRMHMTTPTRNVNDLKDPPT